MHGSQSGMPYKGGRDLGGGEKPLLYTGDLTGKDAVWQCGFESRPVFMIQSLLDLRPIGAAYFFSMPLPISFNSYKNLRQQTSKQGRIWREKAIACIWDQCGGKRPDPLVGRCAIYYELWMPDHRRKRDADNYSGKHVLDMLVKAGVFEDDNTGNVVELHVYYRGKLDKGGLFVSAIEI